MSVFLLPERLARKSDPALVGDDERHLAAVADALARSVAELSGRLDERRREPGREGQHALERDQDVHRMTARLRTLRRFGADLCLGRVVPVDGPPVYIGRLGLTDDAGRRLLVDWRSPAAESFFAATHGDPMGLVSRRRYRWTDGRVTDYWDEVFADSLDGHAALDDRSAFIASLGGARSGRMRDVLGTIQADQDAIIRAGSSGALVVDGGPGTGKTVVALHRAAYLLYSDPRIGNRHGGVLFVGPSRPYLDYVADVLPGLGEDGVRTCMLADLVPEGAAAQPEPDSAVARLKSSGRLVDAVAAAVAVYEQPPVADTVVETDWDEVRVSPDEWAEAFAAVASGTPHNEARETIVAELTELLGRDDPAMRRALRAALARIWPLLRPAELVGDLWTVPALLRHCAPWLDRDEIGLLQRADPTAWTTSDLPLLDAARRLLGDPDAEGRARRRATEAAAEQDARARVTDDLVASDDSEMLIMSMLRRDDLKDALADTPLESPTDPLAGPFAHVVVDEAQELTDAQWRMVLARCPSGSVTVVGDRAQSRLGFSESWPERLARVGLDHVAVSSLTINYRTPIEVMAAAEPVIRAALPDANVPMSVRETGLPVRYGSIAELDAILGEWAAARDDGVACVIGSAAVGDRSRVRVLTPQLVKGLEFDLVVLVDPDFFGKGVLGAVDRYVAMTRATRELVVLTSG